MKKIELRYSYHAWGFNEDEYQIIDLENKIYARFDKDALLSNIPLTSDIIEQVALIFDPIYKEFPQSVQSFDAPRWTLRIDDKSCTRIAIVDDDPYYKKVVEIFNVFKKYGN